jgi:hypothetical protein
MALFAVEITYTAIVEAIDFPGAVGVTRKRLSEIASDTAPDINVCGRVTSARTAKRYGYDADAFAYSNRQVTIAAALESSND